jgi:hypothetical protein
MRADSAAATRAARRHTLWRFLDRVLLCVWLLAVMPAAASDTVRHDQPPSFAAEGDRALLAAIDPFAIGMAEPEASSRPALSAVRAKGARPVASPTPPSGLARILILALKVPRSGVSALAATPSPDARSRFAELVGLALDGTSASHQASMASLSSAAANRYTRGGICFDCPGPLSLSYPASLDGNYTVRYDDLQVLAADANGASYQRFVTEFDRQVYVYPELAAGTFVLSVHDGTMPATGRELESEPLRRMLEGDLHSSDSADLINERLADLVGLTVEISAEAGVARFRVAQARRMSANDVADYLYRPMELSLFMEPIPNPETSFLMLICSGRQPDEPQRSFPGRYVFVLQETRSTLTAPARAPADSPS